MYLKCPGEITIEWLPNNSMRPRCFHTLLQRGRGDGDEGVTDFPWKWMRPKKNGLRPCSSGLWALGSGLWGGGRKVDLHYEQSLSYYTDKVSQVILVAAFRRIDEKFVWVWWQLPVSSPVVNLSWLFDGTPKDGLKTIAFLLEKKLP